MTSQFQNDADFDNFFTKFSFLMTKEHEFSYVNILEY